MNIAQTAPTLIYRPESFLERFDSTRMFHREQPIELELGSGDGSFLARYAAQHPEINLIGVERLLGRLRKLDKKGIRAGCENLRLVRIEATYLLQYLIQPQSLQAIHIYFPDPWPKRKHRRNRLINEDFTTMAAGALKPGGIVWLRTDDLDYFEQMVRVFSANPRFAPVETPAPLAEIITDFERGFHARGVSTQRAAYHLKHQ